MRFRGRINACFIGVVALLAPWAATPAHAAGGQFSASYDASVPLEAHPAIERALAHWSALVSTPVPVVVAVRWGDLPPLVAAASDHMRLVRATPEGDLEPVALADALSGRDLRDGRPDVSITFSTRERWQFDPDTPAPPGYVDVETFALHEIGHALGLFTSFHDAGDGQVAWGRFGDDGSGFGAVAMDRFLVDGRSGAPLLDKSAFPSPSAALRAAVTSGAVLWSGAARDAARRRIRIESPRQWNYHCSLAHLAETAYPSGSPDALMTTTIGRGETIHQVGPAALGMLQDLGWTVHPDADAPPPPPPPPLPAPPVAPVAVTALTQTPGGPSTQTAAADDASREVLGVGVVAALCVGLRRRLR
ncbi:MAG TPA: hypothetical protein VHD87_04740 [Acidimicrobiales bacterium]|nr:hypothetical protein [Acidimicrobiales bacterium]